MPTDRVRYLAEITETVRGYHAQTDRLAEAARRVQRLELVEDELVSADYATTGVEELLVSARRELPHELADQIDAWPAVVASYSGDEQVVSGP